VAEKTLKQVVADAGTVTKDNSDKELKDVQGSSAVGTEVAASHSGKKYHLRPVSLSKVPELTKVMTEVMAIITSGDKDDYVLATENDGALIKKMCQIIYMGIQEDITIEQVGDEFSIGDFPNCLEHTLDMNDFLVGMRKLIQKRMTAV
jgi:hypothetical protein